MATVNDIVQRIWQKLDDTTFYTEGEVIRSGINPAQRLLCLFRPNVLTVRTAVSVLQEQAFLDLRQDAPRAWQIVRVIEGTITGEDASRSNGEFREILPTTLPQLMGRRDWFSRKGALKYYARYGRTWLVFSRRPIQDTTVTVVYRAVPTVLLETDGGSSPDVQASYHPLLTDVATGLLLIKEGVGQQEKAVQMMGHALGMEAFDPVRKVIARMQREAAQNQARQEATA